MFILCNECIKLKIDEEVSQIGNIHDVDRVLKSIDECINLLEIFYTVSDLEYVYIFNNLF